jgi:hypothetical protein
LLADGGDAAGASGTAAKDDVAADEASDEGVVGSCDGSVSLRARRECIWDIDEKEYLEASKERERVE